jgi:Phage integrase, N-terminal SAM-like domain/Transposase, Mutator family
MALDQSALLELLDALKSADADDVVRRSLEAVFQALIEAEATARIGAEPHQRTEARTTQRNGYRLVTTPAGGRGAADPEAAHRQFPKVETMLRDAADITAFADFPTAHWKKIWATNPLVVWSVRVAVLHVWSRGREGARAASWIWLSATVHEADLPEERCLSRGPLVFSPLESWTVLGDDDVPVAPIGRCLAYLTDIERSPNTVKAYAHDLKDWFTFLGGRGLDWREVRLEDVGEFVSWLRLPPPARDSRVAVLPSVAGHCTESTVNRKLSALSAFYTHAARHGVDLGELLTTWGPGGRRGGGWKPFLHHISKGLPAPRRTIALKVPRKPPRVLTAAEVQAILDACEHLRDRLLFAVLYDSGRRVVITCTVRLGLLRRSRSAFHGPCCDGATVVWPHACGMPEISS